MFTFYILSDNNLLVFWNNDPIKNTVSNDKNDETSQLIGKPTV